MNRQLISNSLLKQDIEKAREFLGWNPQWECGMAEKPGVKCAVADITVIPTNGEPEAESIVCFRRYADVQGFPLPLELIKVTVSKHSVVTKVEVTG